MRVPEHGLSHEAVFAKLEAYRRDDTPWREGRTGVSGTSLPGRMAEINEVRNALPVPLRERLLVECPNVLYQS